MGAPFSDIVMDHFHHPRHVGSLESPSGEGWAGTVESGCYMRIQVQLEADRVAQARFATYGCVPAIAAGSFVAEWVSGRRVDEVERFTADELIAALGGLPEERRFCADLALDALRAAVKNALQRKGEVG